MRPHPQAVQRPVGAHSGLIKIINIGGILALHLFYVPYLTQEIGVPVSKAVLVSTIPTDRE
ncbi:MAG: hypothetical protein LBE08_01495 [Bifidobacteriaceae bacterium]|jgi:hypothetical protein|nr:hypothetical protein [Bifidobacteriaceae bacterium]